MGRFKDFFVQAIEYLDATSSLFVDGYDPCSPRRDPNFSGKIRWRETHSWETDEWFF